MARQFGEEFARFVFVHGVFALGEQGAGFVFQLGDLARGGAGWQRFNLAAQSVQLFVQISHAVISSLAWLGNHTVIQSVVDLRQQASEFRFHIFVDVVQDRSIDQPVACSAQSILTPA